MVYVPNIWEAGEAGGTLITEVALDKIEAQLVENDLSDPGSPASLLQAEATNAAIGAALEARANLSLADISFIHTQSTAAAVWEIVHPLAFSPAVTITDSAGTVVLTEIVYVAPDRVRSIAAGAFSGTARLS